MRNRVEDQSRLLELNTQFLKEVESGAGWRQLKEIIEEMKEIAKRLDHVPATVIPFDNYPLNNTRNAGESQ